MNVVVTVKQIPDPAEPGALDPDNTLKRDGKLTCLEPTCKAEYTVEDLDSDLPKFQIVQLDFECVSCKTKNYVGQHRLKDGLTITCCNCPAKFYLDQIWRIRRVEDA